MNVEEAYEWSRHYDNLLWTVAGILGASIAALLAYAYGRDSLSLGPPLLGLGLTLASAFFACSWRVLRRRLNEYLESVHAEEIKYFVGHPMFRQWYVFLALHIALLRAWVDLLITHDASRAYVWRWVGIGGTLFIVSWGMMADHLPLEKPRGKRSA